MDNAGDGAPPTDNTGEATGDGAPLRVDAGEGATVTDDAGDGVKLMDDAGDCAPQTEDAGETTADSTPPADNGEGCAGDGAALTDDA